LPRHRRSQWHQKRSPSAQILIRQNI
jgi:hypothetical protein